MMNFLLNNTGRLGKQVYNYQRFSIFNRIKNFLSKKPKEDPIPENRPKDKLIVIDHGLTEFEKSRKDIKDKIAQEAEETKRIRGKVKKIKVKKELTPEQLAEKELKEQIFKGRLEIKEKKTIHTPAEIELRRVKKEEKRRQQFQNEKVLIDELVHDIKLEKASQQLIELKPEREVLSLYKKIEIIEEFANGNIALLEIFDENGSPVIFENKAKYLSWKEKQLSKIKKQIKFKLNPREDWIMNHQGLESPRTGEYWDFNKVGLYACKVCTQRLFSSTHKYESKCGHATFWNYLPYTLDFKDGAGVYPEPTQSVLPIYYQKSQPVKRICCSNCESHIGLVFDDGPAPFFKRLLVNSAAVKFLDLGWFESPDAKIYRKKIDKINKKLQEKKETENIIEKKEVKLKKLLDNLQDTIKFENQLNNQIIMDNYKEYERNLKEIENKELKENIENVVKNEENKENENIQEPLTK